MPFATGSSHVQKARAAFLMALLCAMLLAACSHAEEGGEQETASMQAVSVEEAEALTGISADAEGGDYMEGEVLVTFRSDVPIEDAEAMLRNAPSIVDERISDEMMVDGVLEDGLMRAGVLDEPIVLVHTSDGAAVVQAIAEARQSDLVIDAEPNYIFMLDAS